MLEDNTCLKFVPKTPGDGYTHWLTFIDGTGYVSLYTLNLTLSCPLSFLILLLSLLLSLSLTHTVCVWVCSGLQTHPIGPAVRADFRRLYPANAKTPTCCPSDDNRTKVTNSVTSARSLWWHVGPVFLARGSDADGEPHYVYKTLKPVARPHSRRPGSSPVSCFIHQPQMETNVYTFPSKLDRPILTGSSFPP